MIAKKILLLVLIAVVFASGGFYGGMKYVQAKNPRGNFSNLTAEQRQQMAANAGAGIRTGQERSGFNAGGIISGEMISKDEKSITLKLRDGGSKIIFYSSSTLFSKNVEGSLDDLKNGDSVMASGQANQDGSLIAQTIQIRPNVPSQIPGGSPSQP